MKVSLKSTTASTIKKLGTDECFLLSQDIRDAACGLAYAGYALSKERKTQARDKAVQVTDVSAGLVTTSHRTEAISKSLKASGYDKLAREAKSIGKAASKLNQEIRGSRKKAMGPLGRVKSGDVEKLKNRVEKLRGRMDSVSKEARETCRG